MPARTSALFLEAEPLPALAGREDRARKRVREQDAAQAAQRIGDYGNASGCRRSSGRTVQSS